jgi:hypothetical protein
MTVLEATEKSIAAADHLTDMDAGAVAALRVLAQKIDTEDALRAMALEYAAEHEQKPPAVDNVSIPTYLKFCESLGLTPAGRKASMKKEAPSDDRSGVAKRRANAARLRSA